MTLTVACSGQATKADPEAARSRGRAAGSTAADARAEIEALRRFEESRRESTDFAARRPWSDRAGADPFVLSRLDDGRWLGLERGSDALVVLDGDARAVQRLPAPARPTGLAFDDSMVWVVGEGAATIARYRVEPSGLVPAGMAELPGSHALRDVAVGPGGWVYVADRHRGRLRAVRVEDGENPRLGETFEVAECLGASRLQVVAQHLLGVCVLDHSIMMVELGDDGRPSERTSPVIRHDGPIWSLDASADANGIALVVGGVENRPLDRSDGSFGYIDAYVFAYRIETAARQPAVHRRAEVNVSAHGVITPKDLHLRATRGGYLLTVSGYGGDRMIELGLDERLDSTGSVRGRTTTAGIAAFDGGIDAGIAANPLLDAWVVWGDGGERVVKIPHPEDDRTAAERLGEALVFTKLMAPWNDSVGKQSRFTCETCHFEGTVDGRVHWTGREDVHATSKTLQGLFENRPHFTRALDRTLTQMVHNEFRVANAASDVDPWFTLAPAHAPWIRWLGVEPSDLEPEGLRKAVMSFLMSFTHEANPAASGRAGFDALERRGATLFAEHCESCHRARLVADRSDSRVPFEDWEGMIFAGGPIVWAEETRRKTGIEPYVHRDGARTPSLRRLWVKRPYFTNGSAPDLDSVLERVRVGDPFAHGGVPGDAGRPLATDERRALAAFLDLL